MIILRWYKPVHIPASYCSDVMWPAMLSWWLFVNQNKKKTLSIFMFYPFPFYVTCLVQYLSCIGFLSRGTEHPCSCYVCCRSHLVWLMGRWRMWCDCLARRATSTRGYQKEGWYGHCGEWGCWPSYRCPKNDLCTLPYAHSLQHQSPLMCLLCFLPWED